ncbi:MAG: glycosyltransferase family 2 protein [Lentisphaerales bacterium]|nr:glycosyltransferase family 2 protein [Lentisphaerales bacterium]
MYYILLPAYNEEISIDPLLSKITNEFSQSDIDYHIIICDDGSTDNTVEKVNDWKSKVPLTLITHKINRGLGESARDLFEKAVELANDEDVIIRMDCDDTHEPKFIISLAEKLKEGYDVVIASRFAKGGGQMGVNTYRSFLSRAANLFMKVVFPVKGLKEYSCGYRAYRVSIIKEALDFYGNLFIQLKGLGFTCTLEKVVKLKIIGARFGEVAFLHRYDQKKSSSKMVSSITTLGYITMALLYHWPFGGWRRVYKLKYKKYKESK